MVFIIHGIYIFIVSYMIFPSVLSRVSSVVPLRLNLLLHGPCSQTQPLCHEYGVYLFIVRTLNIQYDHNTYLHSMHALPNPSSRQPFRANRVLKHGSLVS